jgi:hypothetical protein
MDHTKFLLRVEREDQPHTVNHYFNSNPQKVRNKRRWSLYQEHATKRTKTTGSEEPVISLRKLERLSTDMSNSQSACEDVFDSLKSYYKVAGKRFVDNICQQAVCHFLLDSKDGPLYLFNTDAVMRLTDEKLEDIAGEDTATKRQREKLIAQTQGLQAAGRSSMADQGTEWQGVGVGAS